MENSWIKIWKETVLRFDRIALIAEGIICCSRHSILSYLTMYDQLPEHDVCFETQVTDNWGYLVTGLNELSTFQVFWQHLSIMPYLKIILYLWFHWIPEDVDTL